jgi:hypothetical protein
MQNGLAESFNGRLRDEYLNETLFSSLAHARAVLAEWKNDYNHVRPHTSLGGARSRTQCGPGHTPAQLPSPPISGIKLKRDSISEGLFGNHSIRSFPARHSGRSVAQSRNPAMSGSGMDPGSALRLSGVTIQGSRHLFSNGL